MKKYAAILLIIALVFFMLFVGISYGYGRTSAPEDEEAAGEAEAKSGLDYEVIIENFAFNPSGLTIKAGDAVTWTNNNEALHTVKMDAFESDTLSKGDTFSFTFSDAGIYEYICGIQPYMHGKIIVE